MTAPNAPDRRRSPRAHVAAVATVFAGDECVGQYLLRNLSSGGALLISGPPLPAGTACRMVLRGAGLGNLCVDAETLRAAPAAGEAGLAVSFQDLDAGARRKIEHVVTEALEAMNRPGVLVVDPDVSVLASMAEDLFLLGRRALLALTPLEAVRWLCDPGANVEAAFVGLQGRAGAGPDLLAYIAEEFPSVHRVLMHPDVAAGELLAALEESNARALLRQPWTGPELGAALRRAPRRPSLCAALSRTG